MRRKNKIKLDQENTADFFALCPTVIVPVMSQSIGEVLLLLVLVSGFIGVDAFMQAALAVV